MKHCSNINCDLFFKFNTPNASFCNINVSFHVCLVILGPRIPRKNHYFTTIRTLPRGWRVWVEIMPLGTQKGWSNILHATIGGNLRRYGDRTPGIWFRPGSTKLHICSPVNGNKNFCFDTRRSLPLNKYTKVAVMQTQVGNSSNYMYRVFINNKLVYKVLNKKAGVFRNVKYFVGDPWHAAANAKIKDLAVTLYQHRG